jgi:hypothetical protein
MKQPLHLPSSIRSLLAEIPESAMGAQRLDIILADGRIIPNVSIYNGEDAMLDFSLDVGEIIGFREANGRIWKLKQ